MPVTLKVGGDNKEAIKVVEQLQKKVEQLEAQNRKLNQETKKGAEQGAKGFEAMAASAGKAALTFISVQAAISTVNQLLRDQIALQDQVAAAQSRAADTQRAFLINLGNISSAEKQVATNRVLEISKATGASPTDLFATASTAVSARGDLSIPQSLDAVFQAARVRPRNAGEQNAIAGGLLDLASLTGTGNAKQNLGVLAAVGSQARITNLQQISSNLVPAATNVAQRGGTAAEALAQIATITGQLADATGSTSGTAGIQLANQLADFLPEKDTPKFITRNGRKVETVDRKGTGLSSSFERIIALQNDPQLRKEFLSQASFEQKAGSAIELLLTKDSKLSNLLFANAAAIPQGAAAERAADEFVATLNDNPIQRLANRRSDFSSTAERLRLSDSKSARQSVNRTGTEDVLSASGAGYLERTASSVDAMVRSFFGSDLNEFAEGELRGRSRSLLSTLNSETGIAREVSADDKRVGDELAGIVNRMIGALKGSQKIVNPDRHIEK